MFDGSVAGDEAARLAALHALNILDTPEDERFERVTRIAARLFDVPIALVTLVDANRQWFKSCVGLPMRETDRNISFCAYTIQGDDPLVIPDAEADPRFADNPLVTGELHIRFYAGQPLHAPGGERVGALCILDRQPRSFSAGDRQSLRDLATWAESALQAVELAEALDTARSSHERISRQAALLDLAHDAIIARELETDTITFWNRGAEALYGWTRDEAVGTVSHSLLKTRFPVPLQQIEEEVVATGQWEGELVHQRRDGSEITVESRWALERDGAGKPVSTLEINRDITRRKRAEGELQGRLAEVQAARSEVRAVLDAASDAMILVDSDRRFLTLNRRFEEMFRISAADVIGRTFAESRAQVERVFVDPEGFAARVAGSAGNTEREFTDIVVQRWPEPRDLHLFSTPVRSPSGKYIGRLYVFRDVTREREVDRMKTEFVSTVSHELRTPLTSIKGFVDLLLEGEAGDLRDEVCEFLGIVKNNADRLVALVNDLLDVSRIESGKIQLQPAPLNLTSVVDVVTQSSRPQMDAKAQRLVVDVPDGLPPVLADRDRLIQIVTNLFSNAYKYTPSGGTITISACQEGAAIRLSVQDTGIGMTLEEQEKIFSRFFRARNRMTQEAGGTGLGLSITRSLVEMHGGTIEVISAPNEGSTFSVTLPLAVARAAATRPSGVVPAGGMILVVDDEPDIADLVRRYLERAGYTVLVAATGEEALELARAEHPDLITLDLVLPDVDGFTVLERLKGDEETCSIPVIMLSILDESEHGKLLGAVDYLTKPLQEHVLLQHIEHVLAGEAGLVLVADDEADIRSLIARLLQNAGYEVMEAADGAEAVTLVRQRRPGLVLMDVNMTPMDGITALRAIRAEIPAETLPIIMMTASPGVSDEQGSVIGCLGSRLLSSKPHTPRELAEAIARGSEATEHLAPVAEGERHG